jgi:prolyl-tRNA synthetase
MRYSQVFSKSSKSRPADAESVNARYLIQGSFVHQEMAGVYTWLPLGLRVLRKVENIIREEMDAIGAQETRMSSLQPKENWLTTGRWNTVDVLFKVPSQTGKEYALGPSHEEIATPLVRDYLISYKDLPVAVYQIATKFRDELRAKSGVMRGREFGMKDLYSFHTTQEDLDQYYEQVKQAYLKIFARCGVDVKVTLASGGIFSKKLSHEFQIITPAGEDLLIACPQCIYAENTEVATKKAGEPCPSCSTELIETKGVEAANIFDLGTQYTDAFGYKITDEKGEPLPVLMGCYGIGTTRLVGAIVEASHDEKGIIWPKGVAPFAVHIVVLGSKDEAVQATTNAAADKLYADLQAQGVEVLMDDRAGLSAGEKFADADLLGMPVRVVVSEKSLKNSAFEVKLRSSSEATMVPVAEGVQSITNLIQSNP